MLEKRYGLSSVTSAELLIMYGMKDLFTNLKAAGVSVDVLRWFQSYFLKRRQRVVLPGSFSECVYIKAGVLQGSILGPILFYSTLMILLKILDPISVYLLMILASSSL